MDTEDETENKWEDKKDVTHNNSTVDDGELNFLEWAKILQQVHIVFYMLDITSIFSDK